MAGISWDFLSFPKHCQGGLGNGWQIMDVPTCPKPWLGVGLGKGCQINGFASFPKPCLGVGPGKAAK